MIVQEFQIGQRRDAPDQNPCSLIGSRLDAGLRAIGTDLSTVSVDELKDVASRSIVLT
jgi:hypothetical protein